MIYDLLYGIIFGFSHYRHNYLDKWLMSMSLVKNMIKLNLKKLIIVLKPHGKIQEK